MDESIAPAVATSGTAIVFAGTTVVIALISLVVAGIPLVTSLGYAAAFAVVTAVLAAITLLPAVLAIVGERLESLRLPAFLRPKPKAPDRGFWAWWARQVTTHPWLAVAGAAAILAPLIVPFLSLDLGQEDVGATPKSTTERQAYDLMAAGFGVGYNGPLLVATEVAPPAQPSSDFESKKQQAQKLQQQLEQEQAQGKSEQQQLQDQADALTQATGSARAAAERARAAAEHARERAGEPRAPGDAAHRGAGGASGDEGSPPGEAGNADHAADGRRSGGKGARTRGREGGEDRVNRRARPCTNAGRERTVEARLRRGPRDPEQSATRGGAANPGAARGSAARPSSNAWSSRSRRCAGRRRRSSRAPRRSALRKPTSSARPRRWPPTPRRSRSRRRRSWGRSRRSSSRRRISRCRLPTCRSRRRTCRRRPRTCRRRRSSFRGSSRPAQSQQQQAEQLQTELTNELTKAGGDERGTDPRLVKLQNGLTATIGVKVVSPPRINKAGNAVIFTVVATTAPAATETADLVRTLRIYTIPQATAGTELEAFVGGQTASYVDLASGISSRLMLVILVVIALSFIVLLTAFRSLVVAAQAAVANVLSVAAAFGVLTAVFQWGWGLNLVGLDTASGTEPIASYVPLMMFAVLFGLSMDYQVFLLSQIEHHRAAHGSDGRRRGRRARRRRPCDHGGCADHDVRLRQLRPQRRPDREAVRRRARRSASLWRR